MEIINGIAASSDIAIAKAYCLVEPDLSFGVKSIENTDREIERFRTAISKSERDLKIIRDQAITKLGEDKAEIFEAHLLVLSDEELLNSVENFIKSEKINAEYALKCSSEKYINLFEQMDNEYMSERSADIRDVTKRVLSHLLAVEMINPSLMSEEVIIVAKDLTPSETAQLNRQIVKGFITDSGGGISHSAIMARSLEIPAVVGTKMATDKIKNGDLIIVDGIKGDVIINPTKEIVAQFEKKKADYEQQKQKWADLVNERTTSADGFRVKLAANIGTPDDVEAVINNGGEGVGLYRTEFLYMGREKLPTEEEQLIAYKKVLEGMDGKPVVVRTLDIGGDKELPYLTLQKEINPFLGFRAIRLCLEEQELFRTQLRALLRASTSGNLKIMFPMIATLDEYRQAKAVMEEEKQKLSDEGIEVSNSIEVGIMVEIPSTAILADQFAKEVDFFSIGTNDLIQYTFAADRMNEQVSYLYQPYSPSILRLVKMVIEAAHKRGKWVGMCGEMAGDETAIPVLLGLGLDEFSMSATSILKARTLIRDLNKSELEKLANNVLYMSTTEEVKSAIKAAVNS